MSTQAECVTVVHCRGSYEKDGDRTLLFADTNTLLDAEHICFTVTLPR